MEQFAKRKKRLCHITFFENRVFCDPRNIFQIGLAKLGVFDNLWIFGGHHGHFSVFFGVFLGVFACFWVFLQVFLVFWVFFGCFLEKFHFKFRIWLKLQTLRVLVR